MRLGRLWRGIAYAAADAKGPVSTEAVVYATRWVAEIAAVQAESEEEANWALGRRYWWKETRTEQNVEQTVNWT